jgi:hypothetical protein
MANSGNSIKWNAIREIAASSLTTSYQVFGAAFTQDCFRIWLTNNSNGDIYVSTDGVTNMIKIPAYSGRAYDNKTNDAFVAGSSQARYGITQFYVAFASAPMSPAGWVGLEAEYV